MKKKKVIEVTKFLKLDDEVIKVPHDFYDMLEGLRESDGYFTFINVMDSGLKEKLEKLGLIRTSNRGSSYGTEKLEKNFDAIIKSVYG
jgi:hypothetical protein